MAYSEVGTVPISEYFYSDVRTRQGQENATPYHTSNPATPHRNYVTPHQTATKPHQNPQVVVVQCHQPDALLANFDWSHLYQVLYPVTWPAHIAAGGDVVLDRFRSAEYGRSRGPT
jgi:hypothetical protein